MSTIPSDIIVAEILHKLPIKSLLRFKCVSNLYNDIISSPEFINLHLRHSASSNNANRFLIPRPRRKHKPARGQWLLLLELRSLQWVTLHWTWTMWSSVKVNIWVMKEYGVKDSWEKLLAVSYPPFRSALALQHTYPLAYRRGLSDELLVRSSAEDDGTGINFSLFWCSISNKRSQNAQLLAIHGVDRSRSIDEAYVFQGSLVTVPGGNQMGQ